MHCLTLADLLRVEDWNVEYIDCRHNDGLQTTRYVGIVHKTNDHLYVIPIDGWLKSDIIGPMLKAGLSNKERLLVGEFARATIRHYALASAVDAERAKDTLSACGNSKGASDVKKR